MNYLIVVIFLLLISSLNTTFSQQPTKKDTTISAKRDSFQLINKEIEVDFNGFVLIDKEPIAYFVQIQKNLQYPTIAKKNGIEGKVVVRVLVSNKGIPLKCAIQSSDSKLLNEEAINAIMKSSFKPARQNNIPIHCWFSIPVIFKLD